MMLTIIWYLLLPRTFFPFTIPSRASFSRQFLLSQWPSQFIFLFYMSSSIVLPSPTLSSKTPFLVLFLHFCRKTRLIKWADKIKKCSCARKSVIRNNNVGTDKEEENKLTGPLAKKKLPAEGCSRTEVFNPRPTGRMRPSGEFCSAREGYFIKYNALWHWSLIH